MEGGKMRKAGKKKEGERKRGERDGERGRGIEGWREGERDGGRGREGEGKRVKRGRNRAELTTEEWVFFTANSASSSTIELRSKTQTSPS